MASKTLLLASPSHRSRSYVFRPRVHYDCGEIQLVLVAVARLQSNPLRTNHKMDEWLNMFAVHKTRISSASNIMLFYRQLILSFILNARW